MTTKAGLNCRLTVYTWGQNRRGDWLPVACGPVVLPCDGPRLLEAALARHLAPDKWRLLVATRSDMNLRRVLFDPQRALDFGTQIHRFLHDIHARGVTRFELELHERAQARRVTFSDAPQLVRV